MKLLIGNKAGEEVGGEENFSIKGITWQLLSLVINLF